jgi:stage II sporulation protein D
VSGTSYRGGVIPYLNSSGRMNIINYVSTEDYLKGVIASEMYVSYEAEALKAQAVTARSFVLENVKKHASEGFSVCTTTHCQVYKGVSGENEKTSKAVDDTAVVLMYYNGSPVAGYYYANSGGHTENSEDVWSSYVGYLRGKADPYSPDDSWTVKLSKSQISDALSSRGLGDIKSVTIDSVNDSGYVASLTVTGSISSYTITKDSVRSVFGSSNRLKSRLFTIDTEGGTLTSGNSVTVPESGAMYVRTVNGTAKAGQNIYVASSSGTSYVPLNGLQVMNSAGSIKTADYTPAQTVSEGTGTTVIFNNDSDVLIINGKGSGHGVGMSQTGAQAMALQGYTYEDILKFYYTDIEVK